VFSESIGRKFYSVKHSVSLALRTISYLHNCGVLEETMPEESNSPQTDRFYRDKLEQIQQKHIHVANLDAKLHRYLTAQ
jgi:hypothetical protein